MQGSNVLRGLYFFSHLHLVYSRLDYHLMFQRDIQYIGLQIAILGPWIYLIMNLNVIFDSEKKSIWRLNTGMLSQMREQIRTDTKQYFDENDNTEVF